LYKDNISGTHRQAQNLINKLSSRGKGQQKVKETVKQIKKSKMISSIDRRHFDKPLSYSFLTLNTRERNLKEIQHDIFPIVENETKDMLETKKSMKLNIIIHFEICVAKRFKNENKRSLNQNSPIQID
jgi:broad-specificity NMP kinase